jgi:exopolysaccharide biosynthesis polyprenyl glycosylphosphotransferase
MFAVRNLVQTFVDGRIRRGELHYETIAVMGNRADVLNFLLGGEIWRQGHKLQSTLYFEDARDEAGKLRPELVLQFAQRNLRHGTDQLVLVGDLAQLDAFEGVANELKRYALNLLYAPASRNRTLKFLDVTAIGPNNVLRIVRTPMGETSVILKRAFDIVLSSIGLLLLSPLLALVALLIVLESRGPVIFRQARRGFNGDTFMIWKFRSMRVVESGYQMKQAQKNDPRITRIGRFIRATSIDELPQLVNVLTGQMSLVGPRPHAVSHDEELSRELAVYAHRQRIKPGITGWAQVHGFRGETATRAQIEGRVEHDIYYIDNWSIFLDIWIIVLTVFHPAARRNAR